MRQVLGYARANSQRDLASEVSFLTAVRIVDHGACTEVFTDLSSGMAINPPGLAAVMARLGSGDLLVVTCLHRLSREVFVLLSVFHQARERGADIAIVTEGGADILDEYSLIAEPPISLQRRRARSKRGGRSQPT